MFKYLFYKIFMSYIMNSMKLVLKVQYLQLQVIFYFYIRYKKLSEISHGIDGTKREIP